MKPLIKNLYHNIYTGFIYITTVNSNRMRYLKGDSDGYYFLQTVKDKGIKHILKVRIKSSIDVERIDAFLNKDNPFIV